MRSSLPTLAVASFLTLALASGCGGGGGASGPAASAALGGKVTGVDPAATGLPGVAITLLDTAERIVTGPDGSFRFGAFPTGTVTLSVGGDASSGDDASSRDDPEEALASGDRRIELRDCSPDERIELRIRLRAGAIDEVSVARLSSSGTYEREFEMDMRRTDGAPGLRIQGEIELEMEDGDQEFEVEVEYAEPGLVLKAVVSAPDGTEEDLGNRVVDATGEADWELETEDGDPLPFDVASLLELAGYTVEVRVAETGEALLFGVLPDLETTVPSDDDDDDSDDDDEDDDEDDDDSDDDDSDDDDSDDD